MCFDAYQYVLGRVHVSSHIFDFRNILDKIKDALKSSLLCVTHINNTVLSVPFPKILLFSTKSFTYSIRVFVPKRNIYSTFVKH